MLTFSTKIYLVLTPSLGNLTTHAAIISGRTDLTIALWGVQT